MVTDLVKLGNSIKDPIIGIGKKIESDIINFSSDTMNELTKFSLTLQEPLKTIGYGLQQTMEEMFQTFLLSMNKQKEEQMDLLLPMALIGSLGLISMSFLKK